MAYGIVAQIAATCLRKAQNALLLQILKLGTRPMPVATGRPCKTKQSQAAHLHMVDVASLDVNVETCM